MRPISYEGKEPFVFVSYSHKDREAVYEVLGELQRRGFRFWYDEGIAPGSEWPEDIAKHLDAASMVIAFVTPAFMRSTTCRREINFSLSREKSLLPVMLEPTAMSLGMEMQLSAQQMVLRWNFDQWNRFIEKILSYPDIKLCRLQPAVPKTAHDKMATPTAARGNAAFTTDATVVLDPESEPAQRARTATPTGTAAQTPRGTTASRPNQQAGLPAHRAPQAPVGAQTPLGSSGTVWAGSVSRASQSAAQAPSNWSPANTGSIPAAQQPRAYAPRPSDSRAPQATARTQASFGSSGTVWANSPSHVTQPAVHVPNAWTPANTNSMPAAQQRAYAPDASTPSTTRTATQEGLTAKQTFAGKLQGKRPLAVIAVGILAALAAVFLVFGPLGASSHPGCSSTQGSRAGSSELAEVVAHPPFVLEELVSGTTDDKIAILDGLEEYQDEYDDYHFTADSEMATFFADTITTYDDTTEEDMKIFLSEHASSLPWNISAWEDGSSASLAAIKGGDINPSYWNYNSYLHCPDPTSEDIASYVAEAFDFDGIALYRISSDADSYQISGYAISDETMLSIFANKDYWLDDGYWQLQLSALAIDDETIQHHALDSFVYLCSDQSHRSELEDVYVVTPDKTNEAYQSALDQYDEGAFEESRHGLSSSIGSDFDVPFDLADLAGGSPTEAADALGDLTEIIDTGTYSDGEEWTDAYYTASEDMGRCMQINADEDGYDWWDYEEDQLDSAPWYIRLYHEGDSLTRESIADGEEVNAVSFSGVVPASDPTCEDVARYVKELYAFDQIIIYLDPETNRIEGYASTGETSARITGEDNSYDPVATNFLGTYRIELEVDDQSDSWLFDNFQSTYNNAQLPSRYPDSYKE